MLPVDPEATQSPPEEPTVEYEQTKTKTLRPTAGDLDKYIDWDKDDVQDRSQTQVLPWLLTNPCRVSP